MREQRLAAAALALALTALLAPAAHGQTPEAWEPPRMPDGRPDLQGVWLNNVATPLERMPALAERSHLTDEEVATLDRAGRADIRQRPQRVHHARGCVPGGVAGRGNL